MSVDLAKAEELAAITEKLASLTEQDVQTLKNRRPSALAKHDNDRATLFLLYGKAAAPFKSGETLSPLPPALKQRLKDATERLHKALKEQNRLLVRFRHVTEGLVKSIADSVAARNAPTAYAKSGSFAKPAARHGSAMTLNQAV